MTASFFVDTNVLVYARDASEPVKQPQARDWLAHLWTTRAGRLSVQVLSEYYVTVTRKLEPGMPPKQAWADVTDLFAWQPVAIDRPLLERARTIERQRALSWWDSLVVAAATTSGCSYLLTEDLQDGLDIDGLRVLDPFQHSPDEALR